MSNNKISIIIPGAGLGKRMKSYGSKPLINLGNETVLERMVRLFRARFKNPEIILVAGFEIHKICKKIEDRKIKIIENELFEETNVSYSIKLGLEAARYKTNLIVYGDLVFNKETLNFPIKNRCLIYETSLEREGEVGINICDGIATHMSYGLDNRWAQIAVFDTAAKQEFIKLANISKTNKLFGFEIINQFIDTLPFSAYSPEGAKLVEIDVSKNIQSATDLVRLDNE